MTNITNSGARTIDFQLLFENAPSLFLLLSPTLIIEAVSDEYLKATKTIKKEILGKGIFEVFPDNPNDPAADGVKNLKASLTRVLQTKSPDTMAIQKYDIPKPISEGGGFEERYWSPINSPVLNNGEVTHIIHRVEDVTEFMKLNKQLKTQADQMQAEIFKNQQDLQKINVQLKTAHQDLEKRNSDLAIINEALKKSEKTFYGLFESAPDSIIAVDLKGKITKANHQTEATFGYSKNELLGQSVEILIPERYRTKHVEHRNNFAKNLRARPMEGSDLYGKKKMAKNFL